MCGKVWMKNVGGIGKEKTIFFSGGERYNFASAFFILLRLDLSTICAGYCEQDYRSLALEGFILCFAIYILPIVSSLVETDRNECRGITRKRAEAVGLRRKAGGFTKNLAEITDTVEAACPSDLA